jgi:hypothetical protein
MNPYTIQNKTDRGDMPATRYLIQILNRDYKLLDRFQVSGIIGIKFLLRNFQPEAPRLTGSASGGDAPLAHNKFRSSYKSILK